MTDIVERLRGDADIHSDIVMTSDELLEAAAEIRRLRAELKMWHEFGRALASAGMNGLTVPLVPNIQGEPGATKDD